MIKFLLLYMVFVNVSLAEKLTVALEPSTPVVNQIFNVVFRIETATQGTPHISFNPGRAKILGKSNRGVSINAHMINGKFIAKREMIYSYELETDQEGPLTLRDIKVEINNKTLTHHNVNVHIVSRPKSPKGVFLVATPSKTSIYLGEGFNVTYHLYYRYHITGREIQAFPKLNKFIKRVQNTDNREETVEYEGVIYRRFPIYAVRLYPEKTGMLSIDPLKMKIEYVKRGGGTGTPFGSFGLSLGRRMGKRLSSKTVKVEVKPLPVQGVLSGFTGLVGEHEFKLTLNRNKFLVNDAIEARLEVSGPGGLENFDAPKLYQHDNLEEFDTKSSFSMTSGESAKKTFDYTFLARGPLKIEASNIELAIFDTAKEEYVKKNISLPPLSVSGSGIREKAPPSVESAGGVEREQGEDVPVKKRPVVEERKLLAPDFSPKSVLAFPWIVSLNVVLAAFLALLLVVPPLKKYVASSKKPEDEIIAGLKKRIDYIGLYKLFALLDAGGGNRPLGEIIGSAALSKESRAYFEDLLEKVSKKQYGSTASGARPVFRSKSFKEIVRLIRKHENFK